MDPIKPKRKKLWVEGNAPQRSIRICLDRPSKSENTHSTYRYSASRQVTTGQNWTGSRITSSSNLIIQPHHATHSCNSFMEPSFMQLPSCDHTSPDIVVDVQATQRISQMSDDKIEDNDSWAAELEYESFEEAWPGPTTKKNPPTPPRSTVGVSNAPFEITPLDVGRRLWEESIQIQVQIEADYPQFCSMLTTFNEVDLTLLATSFTFQYQAFQKQGKDTSISVGYHFTSSTNLERIATHGLLNKIERQNRGIFSNYHGSSYGEGVYTADNPETASSYGDTGLLVARLMGFCSNYRGHSTCGPEDTFKTGNIQVLRNSAQCCILMQFPQRMLGLEGGKDALAKTQRALEKMLQTTFCQNMAKRRD